MKYIALLILLCGLLASCSPNFYCKHCPASVVKDSVHVTEKDSIVPRDSVVLIPRDSIRFVDSVPCGDFEIERKTKTIYVKVSVKDSVMSVECRCEAIEAKLSWYERHYKKIISNYHSESKTAFIKKKDSWFQHFETWITLAIIAFFVFTGIIRRMGYRLAFSTTPPFISLVKRSG